MAKENVKQAYVKVEKGDVALWSFFEDWGVSWSIPKSEYKGLTDLIRKHGREQIEEWPPGETEDQIVECLVGQMEMMRAFMEESTPPESVRMWIQGQFDDDGADHDFLLYKVRALWFFNVSSLLRLKRIKNDQKNGWRLDGSSYMVNQIEGGSMVAVWGNDTKKTLQRAVKLLQEN